MAATGTPTPGAEALSLSAPYRTATAPAGATDVIIDSASYTLNKLAKLSLKFRQTPATANSISRITGRSYKKHTTNSCSVYLGKNTATDDYADVVKAIKAAPAYKTFNDKVGNGVSFIPEG